MIAYDYLSDTLTAAASSERQDEMVYERAASYIAPHQAIEINLNDSLSFALYNISSR